jgi:hypothetical protein
MRAIGPLDRAVRRRTLRVVQLMTRSARSSSDFGIVRPSAPVAADGESIFDVYVLALNVAEVPKCLPEYPLLLLRDAGVQLHDSKHFRRRLRLRKGKLGDKDSGESAEKRYPPRDDGSREGPHS